MRRNSEVLQAIKQFAKEIGVPTAIIVDMAGEQMSQEEAVQKDMCESDSPMCLWDYCVER